MSFMAMIKGITVKVAVKTATGTVDGFNRAVYTSELVDVDNVLVAPLSDAEILETLNLTGKRAVYQLGIPKGDTHDWENTEVQFFGETFRTIGKPTMGIEANIPLEWNKKVKVEIIG